MLFLFSGINNSFYCDKTKSEIEIGQIAVVRPESVVTTTVARFKRTMLNFSGLRRMDLLDCSLKTVIWQTVIDTN